MLVSRSATRGSAVPLAWVIARARKVWRSGGSHAAYPRNQVEDPAAQVGSLSWGEGTVEERAACLIPIAALQKPPAVLKGQDRRPSISTNGWLSSRRTAYHDGT